VPTAPRKQSVIYGRPNDPHCTRISSSTARHRCLGKAGCGTMTSRNAFSIRSNQETGRRVAQVNFYNAEHNYAETFILHKVKLQIYALHLYNMQDKLHRHSVARVRKRTTPTERPRLIGEVSANFLRMEEDTWSA
jgi:hypothetical protein